MQNDIDRYESNSVGKCVKPLKLLTDHQSQEPATWEVVRIQQSGFCEFPASRKFSYDELYIKMIHFRKTVESEMKMM